MNAWTKEGVGQVSEGIRRKNSRDGKLLYSGCRDTKNKRLRS